MSGKQVQFSRVLVGTCAANFAGAGKIATQVMREVAQVGIQTHFVGLDQPHLYLHVPGPQPTITIARSVEATAISDKALLIPYRLAEAICELVRRNHLSERSITLWATYLFPFCHAALLAKKALSLEGIGVRLVISPAGSDIWQLAAQLPSTAKYILLAPEVDALLTYTQQFAAEIASFAGRGMRIETIFPINDSDRFRLVSKDEKRLGRQAAGIRRDAFVICCHSNMRPIKRPEGVVKLAQELSVRLESRPTVLLMVGPIVPIPREPHSMVGDTGPLMVRWVGVSHRVEAFLRISDVALNWSAHDSFNGSLMEAMASGLPVISTNVVGIAPEIEISGGGKVFFDHEMAEAVDFLQKLAEDEDYRFQTGLRAATYASTTFATERLLPRYLRVFFPNC